MLLAMTNPSKGSAAAQFQPLIWTMAGVRMAANRPGRKNRIIGTVRVGGSAAAFFSAERNAYLSDNIIIYSRLPAIALTFAPT
jgi:hypothetical protein